jgi:hypothetical protein
VRGEERERKRSERRERREDGGDSDLDSSFEAFTPFVSIP